MAATGSILAALRAGKVPEKIASEKMRPRKNFSKKIWSIEKKVIPLHPQTKRQVH